jgi:hypothetical protein
VKFGTNFYSDGISIYGDYIYLTNTALGSASNVPRTFGIGIESGNATINAIGTDTITTGVDCTLSTYCYDYYYYPLGEPLSNIAVTIGSTTTNIPSASFVTDFSTFSVLPAPAVFWEPTTRYYQVKIFYSGTTSITFTQNGSGTGLEPVSFDSTATAYSVASDPDFQHVYEDTTNDKVIFLDGEVVNGTLFETSYDVSSATSTNTSINISNGGDTVDSSAYFSPVEINEYVWAVGRDSGTDNNVYALRTTSGLAAVNATSQASDYYPEDIAQSNDNLYSILANTTEYGQLRLGSMTRAYGGYSEATILQTGDVTTPANAIMANQNAGTTIENVGSAYNTVVGEKFTSAAELNDKTIDGLFLSLSIQNSPTGTATIGTFDTSGNVVTTFGTIDVSTISASQTTYYFGLETPYTIGDDDRIGIKYTGGDGANFLEVYRADTDVYDGTNAVYTEYSGGWLDRTTQDLRFGMFWTHVKVNVYDGTPDTIYTFFESGTDTIRVIKRTSSTSLLATPLSHTTGEPFSVIQLTDKMLIQTATNMYVLNTATDIIATLYSNTFNTRYEQPFLLSPSGRTFSSNPIFITNSTYAINFTPNLGTGEQTGVIVDSVDDATGDINIYAPAKYYYLSANNLTVESDTLDGTTWTISALSSLIQIAPTAYTELLAVNLIENSTIFSEDVVELSCDVANYHYLVPMIAISDDSGCNNWLIYDVSGGAAPRVIPYARTADVVHAADYGLYTFTLSAANPAVYSLETIYDGVIVDTGDFDSGGQLQQRLLYQQCYVISIEEAGTGNSVQTGTICAGDDTVKPISLTGIVIPSDWLGNTWSHSITRYFNGSEITPPNPLVNSTNNSVIFTFQKNVTPYNATVNVINNIFDTPTINANFTFTGATGASVVNMTSYGINSNQTLYFRVYEDGIQVINDISTPQSFQYGDVFDPSYFGLLFGIPLAMSFPFLTAVMFPKSLAYFGSIVTVAILGIMQVFGFLSLPVWFWALITPVVGIAIIVGYKR